MAFKTSTRQKADSRIFGPFIINLGPPSLWMLESAILDIIFRIRKLSSLLACLINHLSQNAITSKITRFISERCDIINTFGIPPFLTNTNVYI